MDELPFVGVGGVDRIAAELRTVVDQTRQTRRIFVVIESVEKSFVFVQMSGIESAERIGEQTRPVTFDGRETNRLVRRTVQMDHRTEIVRSIQRIPRRVDRVRFELFDSIDLFQPDVEDQRVVSRVASLTGEDLEVARGETGQQRLVFAGVGPVEQSSVVLRAERHRLVSRHRTRCREGFQRIFRPEFP